MTANTDELLARMADYVRKADCLCIIGNPCTRCVLLAEYDSLPQRPEGAAVAWMYRFPKSSLWGFTDDAEVAAFRRKQGDIVRDLYDRESPPASAVAEPVAFRSAGYSIWHDFKTDGHLVSHWESLGRKIEYAYAPQPVQAAVSEVCVPCGCDGIAKLHVTGEPGCTATARAATISGVSSYVYGAVFAALIDAGAYVSQARQAAEKHAALASSPAAPAPVIPESEKGR